jgi:hypothetical protein
MQSLFKRRVKTNVSPVRIVGVISAASHLGPESRDYARGREDQTRGNAKPRSGESCIRGRDRKISQAGSSHSTLETRYILTIAFLATLFRDSQKISRQKIYLGQRRYVQPLPLVNPRVVSKRGKGSFEMNLGC